MLTCWKVRILALLAAAAPPPAFLRTPLRYIESNIKQPTNDNLTDRMPPIYPIPQIPSAGPRRGGTKKGRDGREEESVGGEERARGFAAAQRAGPA